VHKATFRTMCGEQQYMACKRPGPAPSRRRTDGLGAGRLDDGDLRYLNNDLSGLPEGCPR